MVVFVTNFGYMIIYEVFIIENIFLLQLLFLYWLNAVLTRSWYNIC